MDRATRGARDQALRALPHEDRQGGAKGSIRGPHLPEPSAHPREGIGDRGRGGKGSVQAHHVVGDVVGGRGEVVEPPLAYVGDVPGGVPLAVAPGGDQVQVLVICVSC